ncbi:MAG: DUF370 domain-containing protein [Oscillospiraceae bacterium]|nr:DUF370 domain-containing protein [Oscillospiraceae bacterium]
MLGWLKKGHFIHLGGDVSIYCNDLLGVFDIERTTVNPSVNGFLAAAQKSGGIYYCSLDIESMPKSFVVTDETVFVTNVSAGTIIKRVKKPRS